MVPAVPSYYGMYTVSNTVIPYTWAWQVSRSRTTVFRCICECSDIDRQMGILYYNIYIYILCIVFINIGRIQCKFVRIAVHMRKLCSFENRTIPLSLFVRIMYRIRVHIYARCKCLHTLLGVWVIFHKCVNNTIAHSYVIWMELKWQQARYSATQRRR